MKVILTGITISASYKILSLSLIFILFLFGLTSKSTGFENSGISLDTDVNYISLDEENDLLKNKSMDTAQKSESENENIISDLFQNARITCSYEYAYQIGRPEHTVDNRPSLRLEWNYFFWNSFYLLFDGKANAYIKNDHLNRAEKKSYLIDGDLRELYLQVSFSQFSLTIGKQIVIWGEADGSAITDVISPRDYSEFVFTTLEESRLGQILGQFNWYSSIGNLSLIINPFPRLDKMPEPATEYYVSPLPQNSETVEKKPDYNDTEYGLRYKKTFCKSDFSLMAGDLVENQTVYKLTGISQSGNLVWEKYYSRFQVLGLTGNFSTGNFLFKAENAYKKNRTFQDKSGSVLDRNTMDSAIGIEYRSNNNYSINLQASNQYIFDWTDEIVDNEKNDTSLISICRYGLLNDTLIFKYMLTYKMQKRDVLHQFSTNYAFTDELQGSIKLDCFNITDENSQLWEYRDKHRIGVNLKYIF